MAYGYRNNAPDLSTSWGFFRGGALPGQLTDLSEKIIASGVNRRNTYLMEGTVDITTGSLYGAAATLAGTSFVMTSWFTALGVAATAGQVTAVNSALATLLGTAGNPAASQVLFVAAINAAFVANGGGITAVMGGSTGKHLVLSSPYGSFVLAAAGTDTAGAAVGLGTVSTFQAQTIQSQVGGIEFGVAVVQSSDGKGFVSAPLLDSDVILGLSMREPNAKPILPDGTVVYRPLDPVGFVKLGEIWCIAAEAVAQYDTVISLTQGNAYDVDANNVPIPGALGALSAGAAGVGRVALDGASGNIKARWQGTYSRGQLGKVLVTQQ